MIDHLELDRFAAVVVLGVEQDVEEDVPHGGAGMSWDDAVEDRPAWL